MVEITSLNKYWWSFLLRGIVAILFGIIALVLPGLTLEVLVLLFAIFIFIEGIMALISAVKAMSHHKKFWLLLIDGIFSIILGLIAFIWPGSIAVTFVMLFGIWAIFTGFLKITGAMSAPWANQIRWLFGLSGALSLAIGILLLLFPLGGALAVVWLIGIYAIIFGAMQIWLSVKLK